MMTEALPSETPGEPAVPPEANGSAAPAPPVTTPQPPVDDEKVPMTNGDRVLVVVASFVLAGWLAALGTLVFGLANPVLVSRPQLLVAPTVVAGRFDLEKKLTVLEVVWDSQGLKPDTTLDLVLPKDKTPPTDGIYFVPLRPLPDGRWAIQQIPAEVGADEPPDSFRIYPVNDQVRRQFAEIAAARGEAGAPSTQVEAEKNAR
ncbi:MAG: hypothetical protein ACRC1K_22210 [Planctomycetia bacterium]